jgi:hypothetical protein
MKLEKYHFKVNPLKNATLNSNLSEIHYCCCIKLKFQYKNIIIYYYTRNILNSFLMSLSSHNSDSDNGMQQRKQDRKAKMLTRSSMALMLSCLPPCPRSLVRTSPFMAPSYHVKRVLIHLFSTYSSPINIFLISNLISLIVNLV